MSETYGWRVAYFPTVMSGPVARFRKGDDEISASRDGVCVEVSEPRAVSSIRPALDAAERVHEALASAYRRRPFGGPEDRASCITAALGHGWTLERPGFGDRWPDGPRPGCDEGCNS